MSSYFFFLLLTWYPLYPKGATTTTTVVSCSFASCANTSTSTASTAVFYTFDSTLADSSSNGAGNATSSTSTSYVTGWVGNAVSLTYANSQRIYGGIINFFNTSFTIEMWLYWTTYGAYELGLFGACTAQSTGRCLFLELRPYSYLYFGFFNDDTVGVTNLALNTWFHAAFVYDYSTGKRFIYLNGVQDASTTAAQILSVVAVNISMGWALTSANMYYGGYMDHLTVSLRAKTACEVLQDATLSAYFPFDSTSSALTDSGPNFLTATGSGYTISAGHLNSAIFFNSIGSYAQIVGVRVLGQTSASSFTLPFSISVWLNPTVANGSVLHVSSTNTGKTITDVDIPHLNLFSIRLRLVFGFSGLQSDGSRRSTIGHYSCHWTGNLHEHLDSRGNDI